MTKIVTESGRTQELPLYVEVEQVLGLDEAGRIVVHDESWMGDHAFGLTLCCNAYDKGVEDGIVCRACYSYDETGNYLFRSADGSWPGLDPVKEVKS